MNNFFEKELVIDSVKQSFVKLDPRQMIKNPIMFTVEICTAIMLPVTVYSLFSSEQGSFAYNVWVLFILFITLLFANFAEAIAEARGKAQADSLRKTREETPAKLYVNGEIKTVSSAQLKKGDEFVCDAGDVIPADGEIVEGLASIDESAITGESAPVIPELSALNIMGLHSPESAILSAVIFNAIIIPLLIPLALRGVKYKPIGASALLRRNLLIYGVGGIIAPFVGIKLIDILVGFFF